MILSTLGESEYIRLVLLSTSLVMLITNPWPDNDHSEKEKKFGGEGEEMSEFLMVEKANLRFYTTLRQLYEGCNIGDVEYCPLARQ